MHCARQVEFVNRVVMIVFASQIVNIAQEQGIRLRVLCS